MAIRWPDDHKRYNQETGQSEPAPAIEYAGCVLEDRERNYHDDSDFYALVWDEADQRIRTIEYATTRFAGGGFCDVDATPEVRAKAAASCIPQMEKVMLGAAYFEAHKVRWGNKVRVVGDDKWNRLPKKHAALLGQECDVFWLGATTYDRYGRNKSERVGVRLLDGTRIFLPLSNVERAEPDPIDEAAIRRQAAINCQPDRRPWLQLLQVDPGMVKVVGRGLILMAAGKE